MNDRQRQSITQYPWDLGKWFLVAAIIGTLTKLIPAVKGVELAAIGLGFSALGLLLGMMMRKRER